MNDVAMRDRGEVTLEQCVTDDFRHDLSLGRDDCSVCGMGSYSQAEVRNYIRKTQRIRAGNKSSAAN